MPSVQFAWKRWQMSPVKTYPTKCSPLSTALAANHDWDVGGSGHETQIAGDRMAFGSLGSPKSLPSEACQAVPARSSSRCDLYRVLNDRPGASLGQQFCALK